MCVLPVRGSPRSTRRSELVLRFSFEHELGTRVDCVPPYHLNLYIPVISALSSLYCFFLISRAQSRDVADILHLSNGCLLDEVVGCIVMSCIISEKLSSLLACRAGPSPVFVLSLVALPEFNRLYYLVTYDHLLLIC